VDGAAACRAGVAGGRSRLPPNDVMKSTRRAVSLLGSRPAISSSGGSHLIRNRSLPNLKDGTFGWDTLCTPRRRARCCSVQGFYRQDSWR